VQLKESADIDVTVEAELVYANLHVGLRSVGCLASILHPQASRTHM